MTGDIDREFHWPHTLLSAWVRLTLFLVLWFNVLWIVDDHRIVAIDFFTKNVRLALWLYLIEFLTELYVTPVRAAAAKPSHVFAAELLRLSGIVLLVTLLNLAARYVFVVAATWALVRVPTPFVWLPYAAAVLPTIIYSSLKKITLKRDEDNTKPGTVVRGGSLLSYDIAQERAAALRSNAARRVAT